MADLIVPIILVVVIIWLLVRHDRRKRFYERLYAAVAEEEARKRQEAAEAERRARELAEQERYRKEQAALHQRMIDVGNLSLATFEKLPDHLRRAEQHLDRSQADFAERAFAPFWDCIEKTAKELGRFDELVRTIKTNVSTYVEVVSLYASEPPQFPLAPGSIEKLSVATSTATRMGKVVRTAQRDFQFATIYEQRKTNQILVAGFTNLAQALDRMTWQITASVEDLTESVHAMTTRLDRSLGTIHSAVGELREQNRNDHAHHMQHAANAAERETRALEMLDNIQRGRRPV